MCIDEAYVTIHCYAFSVVEIVGLLEQKTSKGILIIDFYIKTHFTMYTEFWGRLVSSHIHFLEKVFWM